ncbi:hypothetical protein D9M72_616900 [compost metagenome]
MKPNWLVSIRLPKMKREPSLTKLSTLTKPSPSSENASRPPGISSTTAAKAICRVIPVITSRQSTERLLFENSQAMPISTANPNRPKPILPKPSTIRLPLGRREKREA